MSEEQRVFRKFLAEVRERAAGVTDQAHIDHDTRQVIKDLVEVTHQVEKMMSAGMGEAAEFRILQKRYDTLKQDYKNLEARQNKVKEFVAGDLAVVVKSLTAEANILAEKALMDSGIVSSCQRIKGSVKKLVEAISKL